MRYRELNMDKLHWTVSVCVATAIAASCTRTPTAPSHGASPTGLPEETGGPVTLAPSGTGSSTPSQAPGIVPSLTATSPSITAQNDLGETVPMCQRHGVPQPLPDGFALQSTLVYQDSSTHGYYSLGGSPPAKSQVPIPGGDDNVYIGFSPNGKWLAFAPLNHEDPSSPTGKTSLKTPILVLLSSEGQRIEYPLNANTRTFESRLGIEWSADEYSSILPRPGSYWINDDLLSLLLLYIDPSDPYSSGYYVPRVFEVSSGRWLDEPQDGLPGRLADGQVRFAPDMSLTMYEVRSGDGATGFVLLETGSGKSLWADSDYLAASYATIRWAPDSSQVSLYRSTYEPVEDRISLISRDGSLSAIPNIGWARPGSRIGNLEWSHNSHLVAFDVGSNTANTLYVYDVLSKAYVLQCPLVGYTQASPTLTWSPDSQSIAIGHSSLDEPKTLRLLSITTGEVLELGSYAVSLDWTRAWPVHWAPFK